jgi:hypothetical protein
MACADQIQMIGVAAGGVRMKARPMLHSKETKALMQPDMAKILEG